MDCEKFDRIVLDLLYDELDELTSAAAKRHMEHCTRCRNIGAGLRATREVGTLPLVDAPEGLELRILEAERHATELLPLGKRLGDETSGHVRASSCGKSDQQLDRFVRPGLRLRGRTK